MVKRKQSWQELFKRAAALGFATMYMRTHQIERGPSLRVAYWAYRFMDGDDVHQINQDADDFSQKLETQHHQHKLRVPSIFGLMKGK